MIFFSWAPRDFDVVTEHGIAERYSGRETGGLHARYSAHAFEQLIVKRDCVRFVETDLVRIGRKIHDITRVEAEIGTLRVLHATQEQTRNHQERERPADLHGHQHASHALTPIGRAAASGIQNVAQIGE